MAKLIRLVWRLDYDVSFSYFDSRGATMRAILQTVPGFFKNIAEGNAEFSLVSEEKTDFGHRSISVEPQSINGRLEWNTGTEITRVLQTDEFRSTDKIVKEIMRICSVSKLRRGGLRAFCAQGESNKDERLAKFTKLFDQKSVQFISENLGNLVDIGHVFEGSSLDGLSYRLHYGPAAPKNFDLALSKKLSEEDFRLFERYDTFFDIDIWETDFMLMDNSLFRWAQTKLEKIVEWSTFLNDARMRDQKR